MADFKIKKGFDLNLNGQPAREIDDAPESSLISLHPLEFDGVKQRLLVAEGDSIQRGTPLIEDKRNPNFKLCAPAGGTISCISRGERRFVDRITVDLDAKSEPVKLTQYSAEQIISLSRDDVLGILQNTGYLAYIIQRPFGRIADTAAEPKSIFVNGMNTAPGDADADLVAEDEPAAMQAGLNVLTRLTNGKVNLCVAPNGSDNLRLLKNVDIHTFDGPHPAGNTSVHISRICPMSPHDVIWTLKAVDVALIGHLFLNGALPTHRLIALSGNMIRPECRKHYRIRLGGEIETLVKQSLVAVADYDLMIDDLMVTFDESLEPRCINGNPLNGTNMTLTGGLLFYQSTLSVLPEGDHRRMWGWMMPGLSSHSFSRTFLSSFLSLILGKRSWQMDTNRNGGKRAMVLTGYYDRVMPLNIMVDYLIRAVLAHDTDEAIAHGILETLPEDFALCDFICPCKMEVQALIRQGLEEIEAEGI